MSYTLAGFFLYLVIILIIGIFTYAANKNHKDFFIGGRRLGAWVVAFSERASGESAWLLLGLPGLAFASGIVGFWDALGCISGIIFYWFVIAGDLRIESGNSDSITLPDFFASKYQKGRMMIRVVATFIIIFFFTFYLSAQFNGAGKVLNVTFGIENFWGIVIGAFFIILYTMMGGFFAVALTDMLQGIIMIGALVILPLVGLIEIAESSHTVQNALHSAGPSFSSITGGKMGWAGFAVIISGLSWGLGYMGQPHLLIRFMAIKDPARINISRRIALSWAIPAFAGAVMIGIVGLSLYGKGYFDDVENVMPQLANDLLPTWLAGIFISGAIAAMMSTADSQLLVISSSVMEDIYHKTIGKKLSEKELLNHSRIITILIGVFGFFIAIFSQKLIFAMVSYAWSGLGASFGPALLFTLKWKKTTWQGILAGMITGTLVTVIWANIDLLETTVSSRLAAWLSAALVIYFTSQFTCNSR